MGNWVKTQDGALNIDHVRKLQIVEVKPDAPGPYQLWAYVRDEHQYTVVSTGTREEVSAQATLITGRVLLT